MYRSLNAGMIELRPYFGFSGFLFGHCCTRLTASCVPVPSVWEGLCSYMISYLPIQYYGLDRCHAVYLTDWCDGIANKNGHAWFLRGSSRAESLKLSRVLHREDQTLHDRSGVTGAAHASFRGVTTGHLRHGSTRKHALQHQRAKQSGLSWHVRQRQM